MIIHSSFEDCLFVFYWHITPIGNALTQSTGVMKTKNGTGENKFSPLPFICFHRMHSIRQAVFHRQPVDGRQCRSRFSIMPPCLY